MGEHDLTLLNRIVEGSPVIVLLCLFAIAMLWRRMTHLDGELMKLHRETLSAMHDIKGAVSELTSAIKERR